MLKNKQKNLKIVSKIFLKAQTSLAKYKQVSFSISIIYPLILFFTKTKNVYFGLKSFISFYEGKFKLLIHLSEKRFAMVFG